MLYFSQTSALSRVNMRGEKSMSIDYETEWAALMAQLDRNGYSARTLNDHRRCFEELRKHLSEMNCGFTMGEAVKWLEIRKPNWSVNTYQRYRRAVYRFEKWLRTKDIGGDQHCHNNFYAYHDADVSYIKLPDNYKAAYHEFHGVICGERAKGTVDHYIAGTTDFLLFLAEQNCIAPGAMAIEQPLSYLCRIQNNEWSQDTKKKYAQGVERLLAYFAGQGFIPRCYAYVMKKLETETDISSLKLGVATGAAIQPSKAIEPKVDAFMANLSELRYSEPPQQMYGFIFTSFCLFLEVNHIEYSAAAVNLWINHIHKTTSWELLRQIITRFRDFAETGTVERNSNFVWKPLFIDNLPNWSRRLTDDDLELRTKEGWESSTLMRCRSSCVRFFMFLAAKGVETPGGITPTLVNEFHTVDFHAMAEGRNAYAVRVRKLLEYMADENLVPPNLYLAISAKCAPKRKIITVMSDEMIDAVYHYRETASTPGELRDAAIVMLGLRLGLRSSDIVNLKAKDFDMKKRELSIIQQKTRKAIILSIPVDVGNSVFK
jgi:site-specific recombinase XerD